MSNKKNLTEGTTEVVEGEFTENTGAEGTEGPEDVTGGETEDETEEDGNKVLIAVYPILFQSHQYKVGDTLPTNYPDMVEAWLAAETATWWKVEPVISKARSVTAEPGVTGQAVASDSENGEDLIGKVPKTSSHKRK